MEMDRVSYLQANGLTRLAAAAVGVSLVARVRRSAGGGPEPAQAPAPVARCAGDPWPGRPCAPGRLPCRFGAPDDGAGFLGSLHCSAHPSARASGPPHRVRYSHSSGHSGAGASPLAVRHGHSHSALPLPGDGHSRLDAQPDIHSVPLRWTAIGDNGPVLQHGPDWGRCQPLHTDIRSPSPVLCCDDPRWKSAAL